MNGLLVTDGRRRGRRKSRRGEFGDSLATRTRPLGLGDGGASRRASGIMDKEAWVPAERIDQAILSIRGQRVILDSPIATLYGVAVGRLNQAVSRNLARFPEDFMFQLTEREVANLRSHSVISSSAKGTWGGRRYRPRAFTEHGVVMLSSVLRSEPAVHVNIEVVRAFVRLRRTVQTNRELTRRIRRLERMHDAKFRVVFDAIRALMDPPPTPPKRRIDFHSQGKGPALLGAHPPDR
ncbi:MAG: ORF6N domain-containing protein [Planctomycetota bacterium]